MVLALGLSREPPRAWLERRLPKYMLGAGATLVALAIAEVALRIISPSGVFSPRLPLRPYYKMELHVDLPGVSPQGLSTTNRWGLRGDNPPDDENASTILAVGGSTTQCFYLDDRKTWPALLQEHLRKNHPKVWVGNGGLDGHSTRGHLLFTREVIPRVRPKVVLFLVGVNDCLLSLRETTEEAQVDYDYDAFRRDDFAIELRERLLCASRVVQVAYIWKQVLFDRALVVQSSGHGAYTPTPLSQADADSAWPTDQNGKPILSQLAEFERNIRRIIDLVKAEGARPVFLTQPLRFDDTPYWRGIEGLHYWIQESRRVTSAAQHWRFLRTYNLRLISICRELGVACFDLASEIPHGEECFYDTAHFNEHGAELVAEKVAEFFERERILEDSN